VLDASALVDVLIDRPNKAAVLEHFGQPLVAPAHQLAEVVSALARLRRAGTISGEDAKAAVREAVGLAQEVVPWDAALLEAALALDGRLRVLDAVYVALALRRGCPLLTSDRRLGRADPPCELILAAPPEPQD
jgi:predicted nucleic acid-binding protein